MLPSAIRSHTWIVIPIRVRILSLRVCLCISCLTPPASSILKIPCTSHMRVNLCVHIYTYIYMLKQSKIFLKVKTTCEVKKSHKSHMFLTCIILLVFLVLKILEALNRKKKKKKDFRSNLSRYRIFLRFKHADNLTHLWSFLTIRINTSQSSQKGSLKGTC